MSGKEQEEGQAGARRQGGWCGRCGRAVLLISRQAREALPQTLRVLEADGFARLRAAFAGATGRREGASLGTEIVKADASNNTVRITYRSNWPNTNLHASIKGTAWSPRRMTGMPTGGGRWHELVIDLVPYAAEAKDGAPLMEFVLTDGGQAWDNNDKKNYKIEGPGNYALRQSKLEKVTAPPFLVVSDLDGTLVGDDKALEGFQGFWEGQALQRGCKLVYSSGRQVSSFLLLKERLGDRLPLPDMYIGAVGTKVYRTDPERKELVEDTEWSARLDEDWNLKVVMRAAEEAVNRAGSDDAHFRPKEELNEHKVTLGIKTEKVDAATEILRDIFDLRGVKAKIITSGVGEWRYLDIVSDGAGKQESLEYVRQQLGFEADKTVACGDSGNDLLMLSGTSRAIVVGNAQPDLRVWADKEVSRQARDAEGRGRVYVSEAGFAAGVMEGISKFGWK